MLISTLFSINSLCVPVSTISPFCITIILSACVIVDSLCATMSVVLSLLNTSNASCIIASLSKSNADVASSKIKIGGLFKKILAIERRCFDHQIILRLAPYFSIIAIMKIHYKFMRICHFSRFNNFFFSSIWAT